MVKMTLEILDEAIRKVRAFEVENEVIGFKINPADLREIENGTMMYCGVVNDSIIMIPPYQGFRLESDVTQPRGCVKPMRKSDRLMEG